MAITRKALILAGGWGTRFLPFTKIVPKELLPINGIPAIQYVVEEAIAAGYEEIIIVTRPGCTLTQRYFEDAPQLESYLKREQKQDALDKINAAAMREKLRFVEEAPDPRYGSALPLLQLCAELKNESHFAVLFADDLVLGGAPAMVDLNNAYAMHTPDAAIAMQKIPRAQLSHFGNLALGAQLSPAQPASFPVHNLIQRPKADEIQSDYAVVSRLLLTPAIFAHIEQLGENGELDLGKAVARQASIDHVIGVALSGKWVTVGDPENYRATLNFAASLPPSAT